MVSTKSLSVIILFSSVLILATDFMYVCGNTTSPQLNVTPKLPPVDNFDWFGKRNDSFGREKVCTLPEFVEAFEPNKTYAKFEIPTKRNTTTCQFEIIPVRVGVRVRNIRGINELNEEVTMEIDLITSWFDLLLEKQLEGKTGQNFLDDRGVPYIPLESSFINKIWHPDIFFSKTVSITRPGIRTSHEADRSSKLRLFPKGLVEYYSRLIVTFYCPMDFKFFPADTQQCNVHLRSYALPNSDIELDWFPTNVVKNSQEENPAKKPLAYFYNRYHPNYDIFLHDVKQYDQIENDARNYDENYTYLAFTLSIRRKLTYHVTQTYFPSAFLIVITWLTFFIPLSALEARIGVVMTTLLTMTNNFAGIRTLTPNVSYLKAIDIYMIACIFTVFVTLFEFTFLYWIRKGRTEYAESRVSLQNRFPMKDLNAKDDGRIPEAVRKNSINHHYYLRMRNYVEVYGFLITVVGFLLFNLIYWPCLLLFSAYYVADINLDYNDA